MADYKNNIANASNTSESDGYTDTNFSYSITFRPNENKLVSLGAKRQKYLQYCINDQRQILLNCVDHAAQRGLKFIGLVFEETMVKNKRMLHFHCSLRFNELGTFHILQEHAKLLNQRYGPSTYKAFDYREQFTTDCTDGYHSWKEYISKQIIHPLEAWTAGI